MTICEDIAGQTLDFTVYILFLLILHCNWNMEDFIMTFTPGIIPENGIHDDLL